MAEDMDSRAEALAEAKRRWGHLAYATSFVPAHSAFDGDEQDRVYLVAESGPDANGRIPFGMKHGSGDSWTAAFADADRREGKVSV